MYNCNGTMYTEARALQIMKALKFSHIQNERSLKSSPIALLNQYSNFLHNSIKWNWFEMEVNEYTNAAY